MKTSEASKGRGVFSLAQPTIKIFSEEKTVHFVAFNTDVFGCLNRAEKEQEKQK